MKSAIPAFLISLVGTATLAGDPEAGRQLIESWRCVYCHGLSGNDRRVGFHAVPMIAGQPETFLVKRLQQYRAGLFEGSDESTMSELVRGLDDQEIEDIAAWYARQKRY